MSEIPGPPPASLSAPRAVVPEGQGDSPLDIVTSSPFNIEPYIAALSRPLPREFGESIDISRVPVMEHEITHGWAASSLDITMFDISAQPGVDQSGEPHEGLFTLYEDEEEICYADLAVIAISSTFDTFSGTAKGTGSDIVRAHAAAKEAGIENMHDLIVQAKEINDSIDLKVQNEMAKRMVYLEQVTGQPIPGPLLHVIYQQSKAYVEGTTISAEETIAMFAGVDAQLQEYANRKAQYRSPIQVIDRANGTTDFVKSEHVLNVCNKCGGIDGACNMFIHEQYDQIHKDVLTWDVSGSVANKPLTWQVTTPEKIRAHNFPLKRTVYSRQR